MYLYNAYHLNIASDIEMPMMRTVDFETNQTDVTITLSELPETLSGATTQKTFFEAKPGHVLAKLLEQDSRMLIQNGNAIIIDAKTIDPAILPAMIISVGLSNILLQRHFLILHGNALSYRGKNFIICGKSGAGKSTTTSALMQKGAKLIADDISPIHFDNNNCAWVSPGIPYSKLWPETIELLGLQDKPSAYLSPLREKCYIPLDDEETVQSDQKLDAIFWLKKDDDVDQVNTQQLTPEEALLTIRNNSYGYRFVRGMELLPNHFQLATQLAENIGCVFINRPSEQNTLDDILTTIEQHLTHTNHPQ